MKYSRFIVEIKQQLPESIKRRTAHVLAHNQLRYKKTYLPWSTDVKLTSAFSNTHHFYIFKASQNQIFQKFATNTTCSNHQNFRILNTFW